MAPAAAPANGALQVALGSAQPVEFQWLPPLPVDCKSRRAGCFAMGENLYDPTLPDRLAIRELIENWVLWRDAGEWERFRTVWHPEGKMYATWFQGTADDFIAASRHGFDNGVSILHFLGGQSIELNSELSGGLGGRRAISQTKMTITQRAEVHGVSCDVVCTGRFFDFLEKRDGRWGLVLRRLIYEKDRMDPVDPAAKLHLDSKLLAAFPIGYRHLGYMQTSLGFKVKANMPGLKGAEVQALYGYGRDWLAGKSIDGAYNEA
jgi:hypothetical protein